MLGCITIRFIIYSRRTYHLFVVVKNLPIYKIIGGVFLRQHECQIMDKASGGDDFGITDDSCDVCIRNKEKMKAEQEPPLQATPKRFPAKRKHFSCVVVPTRLPDEEEQMREKLCNVLVELRNDLISVRDSIQHQ